MAEQKHLNNAPITEALVDIRCSLPDSFNVSSFETLPDKFAMNYPNMNVQKSYVGGFEINNEQQKIETQAVDKGIVGYIHKNEQSDKVIQLRNDGLTFSKLKPYETWENLRNEAQELWEYYSDIAKPESVNRIALRYINHLNLPFASNTFNFDDYLTSAPNIPDVLPQGISSFLNRVIIPEPEIGGVAIINQALEGVVNPNNVTILLDIDVFVPNEIDADLIWDSFEKLHTFKNKIFFSYLTEKAVEICS